MRLRLKARQRVKRPGILGGIGYFRNGVWRYGRPPVGRIHPPDGRLALDLKRQRAVVLRGRRVEHIGDVAAAFRAMNDVDRERLWTLALKDGRAIAMECVAVGQVNAVGATPRELLKGAITLGADHIYVVHHHPGGYSSPSEDDYNFLRHARVVAGRLGVSIDGLVVARDGWATVEHRPDDLERPYGMTVPYPASPAPGTRGTFAPPEIAAIRLTEFATGEILEGPPDAVRLMRGWFDPGERTLAAVLLDNRGRCLGVQGLGLNLAGPKPSVSAALTRMLIAESATGIAIAAGEDGPEWSGRGTVRGSLVHHWAHELARVSAEAGVEPLDVFIVHQDGRMSSLMTRMFDLRAGRDVPVLIPLQERGKAVGSPPEPRRALRARLLLKSRPPKGAAQRAGAADDAPALGTTGRGHPVPAGPAAAKYRDADHLDAATRHARAAALHAEHHRVHREASDRDGDWRRSEQHHEEAARHQTLHDHHDDLVRLHLTAAGKAANARLTFDDGKPALSPCEPATDAEREAAKAELAKRSGKLPAQLTDRERQAYARIAAGGEP